MSDTSRQKLPFLLQWTNFPEGVLTKKFFNECEDVNLYLIFSIALLDRYEQLKIVLSKVFWEILIRIMEKLFTRKFVENALQAKKIKGWMSIWKYTQYSPITIILHQPLILAGYLRNSQSLSNLSSFSFLYVISYSLLLA